jgi:hypothetical protein
MGFLKNLFSIRCPYCGGELENKPGRKKRCPHCENYIYIREGEMKTETEKDLIDFVNRGTAQELGVTISGLERERKRLSEQFGAPASGNDAIWSILNKALEPGNPQKNTNLYFEMERIAQMEGCEFDHVRKAKNKSKRRMFRQELQELNGSGMVARVYTKNDHLVCDKCRKLSEQTFSIDELLERMPIPDECENPDGCRCSYGFELK